MAKVGLLGGTFDPIHVGHLIIADAAYDALGLDHVEFLPANDPPHKPEDSVSAADVRAHMVELAIAGTPYFVLNRTELDRTGPSFTVDTLRAMWERRGGDEFTFIIGGDSLRDLPKWRAPERILAMARLAVIDRPGTSYAMDELERALPGVRERIDFIDAPRIDISSTELRNRVREGRSIRFQTADPVRAFIDEMQLYR